MKKPTAKVVEIMDWHSMEKFIEDKYDCILRDFAAHKHGVHKEECGTSSYNVKHRIKWEEKHFPKLIEYRKNPLPNYGLNKEGMDFYKSLEGRKWFTSIREAYEAADDGECKELPCWDFWGDCMIDMFGISNGTTTQINWVELKEECDEDWKKEICDLFIKEFGEEDMTVEFSW